MAQSTAGLEKWQIKAIEKHGITKWKDREDLNRQIKEAAQVKAKANEEKAKDTAVVEKVESKPERIPDNKIEVLPSSAKVGVDVAAPVINVHVPAPAVNVEAYRLPFRDTLVAAWAWVQAFVIGAATWALLSSHLTGTAVVVQAVQ